LSQPIEQLKQALRDYQSFRFQDLTKPLSDLVANCATMEVVKR
jgi:hypothetical protein